MAVVATKTLFQQSRCPWSDKGSSASQSGLAAGMIVDQFGNSAAFLAAVAAAAVAFTVFALRMPKTALPEAVSQQS